jgi:hypothetical protein
MPPVPPGPARVSYLYEHFRPEFLVENHLQLSSDAFSPFTGQPMRVDACGSAC